MKKSLAATAIAATTLGGVAAGATLFTPGLAGAQDTDEATEEQVREFGTHIAEALQPLVDDGTLTDSQVDAVIDALEAAKPEGRGHHGPRGFRGAGEIAEILGMEPQELAEALQSGQTLADVAATQGISTDDLVDAIVDNIEEHVADAVEAGRMDEDKAAEILEGAEDRAEDVVNGEVEFGRRGHGRGGPGGGQGFGPGAESDTAA